MRTLRTVTVTVAPLLADLIRHVLGTHAALTIVAELADVASARARLAALAPELVLVGLGPGTTIDDAAALRRLLPGVTLLAVSEDLVRLHGPADGEVTDLTQDALAARLP